MTTEEFLQARPGELGLSADFCERCEEMGLERLKDILALPPAELVGSAGFSYGWLAELTVFLESQDMLYLLQTNPGRMPG